MYSLMLQKLDMTSISLCKLFIRPQVSKGLWRKWGDKRIIDTPITEVRWSLKCIIFWSLYICLCNKYSVLFCRWASQASQLGLLWWVFPVSFLVIIVWIDVLHFWNDSNIKYYIPGRLLPPILHTANSFCFLPGWPSPYLRVHDI